MDRLLKVATPPTAATVTEPLRLPPPGLVPMGMVTGEGSEVGRCRCGSSRRTVTAGLIGKPASVLLGCTPKTRWLAAAGVMLKKEEVAMPRLPSLAVRV